LRPGAVVVVILVASFRVRILRGERAVSPRGRVKHPSAAVSRSAGTMG
jgi:hypothetical protein